MISITLQTFASDLLNTTDLIIGTFVQTGFQNLVSNNMSTITLAMTMYIAFLGYKFLNRSLELELITLVRHLILLVIVYALLTNWQFFYTFIYNIFTNEPAQICQTAINSNGNLSIGGQSIANALNSIFNQGLIDSQNTFKMANIHNPFMYFYGFILLVSTIANCVYAVGLLVYAKMAMAIALFLSPIFIIFLLWESTRNFFNKWTQKLFNYALYPIVTTCILMFTLSMANAVIPGLTQNVNSGNATFSGVMIYAFISIINFYLIRQVQNICAALSGGVSLEALGSALPIVTGAAKISGITYASKKAGNLANKGMSSARNAIVKKAKELKAKRAQARRDKK